MISAALTGAAGRMLRLPPARTTRITLTRDIRVRARDGARLLTDHYAPASAAFTPTVLIRTPYGRGGAVRLLGRIIAERGFHAVIQSCRGTYGSDGTFEPLVHERADGSDTLDWLRRQPWYVGSFGTFGASYQGFVQWALAAEAGDELTAMVAVVTASQTRDSTYGGEGFSLDTVLTWAELLSAEKVPFLARQVELKRGQPRLAAGMSHLPLAEADRVATGATIPFFQEWLREAEPGAVYWRDRVFDAELARVAAPVLMIGGWQDIFLPAQLSDYAALRAAGGSPYLTIGPWTHGSPGLLAASIREGLGWLTAHLLPDAPPVRELPVRVFVGGGGGWRDLPAWPPRAEEIDFYLQRSAGLSAAAPEDEADPTTFRYDPRDPTPSVGGPLLVGQRAGRYDNTALEARPDVRTFTGPALSASLEVVGPVSATVYLRSELAHFDVFVRLCDVDERGRSWNLCDGLVRITPGRFAADADGVVAVSVPMWPVAHRFGPGHRLRVQISGGAHPRYARNPGTGEPLGTAVALRAGRRAVFHDAARPSAVHLRALSPY